MIVNILYTKSMCIHMYLIYSLYFKSVNSIAALICTNIYIYTGTLPECVFLSCCRCTSTDDNGDDVLCCLLQSTSTTSAFTCDVIDPIDVAPVIRNNEHLVSCILRVSPTDKNLSNAKVRLQFFFILLFSFFFFQAWISTLSQ